jgi:ethanolamine ammonia-lyase small subunit
MSEFFDKKSERKTLANSVFKNGELDDICHMMSRKMVDVNNPNIA